MKQIKIRYQYFRYRLSSLAAIEQDSQVRNFFYVLLRKNGLLKHIIESVFRKRPNLTDEHLAYLLFAALQYLTDFEYDHLAKKQIKNRLDKDIPTFSKQIIEICQNNNLSTQVPNRYSALQVALATMQKPNKSIIDLGCSAGWGLMALNSELLRNFSSSDIRIVNLANKPVDLGRVVGLDSSSGIKDLRWLSACIFPEIKEKRNNLFQLWNLLKAQEAKVETLHMDVKNIINNNDLEKRFDIVWTSSTLYQIGNTFDESFSEIRPALEFLLSPNGIWIDAYYKKWDIDFASVDNPYQFTIYQNGNFDKPLIFLKSDSDNVFNLEAGENFEESLTVLESIG